MKIAIRLDVSAAIGAGHLYRCLALANALMLRGAEVTFLCQAPQTALHRKLLENGRKLVLIDSHDNDRRDEAGCWFSEDQLIDAQACLTQLGTSMFDWIVVDHYLLGRVWEQRMRDVAGGILVIDDIPGRQHDCDILVDQTLSRTGDAYHRLVPQTCRVLAGTNFAILRPEFAALRKASLERRAKAPHIEKVMINFGATDAGNLTIPAFKAIRQTSFNKRIIVVVGSIAPHLSEIRNLVEKDGCSELHCDAENMAELMAEADLCVGASGATTWERSCLGLPSMVLCVAKNQHEITREISAIGAAVTLESVSELGPTLKALLQNPACLPELTAACAPLTDGLGTERVVDGMLRQNLDPLIQELQARRAVPQDSMLLWLWRNDPVTRKMANSSDLITWNQHNQWYGQALDDAGRHIFVIESERKPVAMIRFDKYLDGALVSINMNPAYRGRNLGRAALSAGLKAFETEAAVRLYADIHRDNLPSQRIFGRCGFVKFANRENGFDRYARA